MMSNFFVSCLITTIDSGQYERGWPRFSQIAVLQETAKFTNDSDYCILNGVGGYYFNFAAQDLYSSGIVNATGIIYENGNKLNFYKCIKSIENKFMGY